MKRPAASSVRTPVAACATASASEPSGSVTSWSGRASAGSDGTGLKGMRRGRRVRHRPTREQHSADPLVEVEAAVGPRMQASREPRVRPKCDPRLGANSAAIATATMTSRVVGTAKVAARQARDHCVTDEPPEKHRRRARDPTACRERTSARPKYRAGQHGGRREDALPARPRRSGRAKPSAAITQRTRDRCFAAGVRRSACCRCY